MEETVSKVTYAKNLNKQNFSASISIPIDTNVNIKTILQIDSYLFDEKVECGNGKAIMSGKIGVKVLYVDKDNITNTITDSLTFSETILDNSIVALGAVVCKKFEKENVLIACNPSKIIKENVSWKKEWIK